uniref:Uncharacterized protein n=1 Tax=Romanomermis culicivorax TaxID=13658 RepID=A0A915IF69_ROMCU
MDDQRCDPKALLDNKENRPRIRASDAPRAGQTLDAEPSCGSNLRQASRSSLKSTNNLSNLWRKSWLSLRNSTTGVKRYQRDSLWSLNHHSMRKNKHKFDKVARTIEFDECSTGFKNADDETRLAACSETDSSLIREQGPEEFLDMVVGIQSRRMDDQRAILPELPGLQHPAQVLGPHLLMAAQQRQKEQQQQQNGGTADTTNTNNISDSNTTSTNNSDNYSSKSMDDPSAVKNSQVAAAAKCEQSHQLDDDFIEMLMRCQSTRIDEQRSELPDRSKGITVPDDDFFQLVLKIQARRFEEQRANFVKGQSSKDK